MQKSIWYLIGFFFLLVGILSAILNLLGLYLSFFGWINSFGPVGTLLIHLFMIFGGMTVIILTKIDIKNSGY